MVNGKSIMGILLLAAGKGTALRSSSTAPTRPAASAAVVDLVESGFGEMAPATGKEEQQGEGIGVSPG